MARMDPNELRKMMAEIANLRGGLSPIGNRGRHSRHHLAVKPSARGTESDAKDGYGRKTAVPSLPGRTEKHTPYTHKHGSKHEKIAHHLLTSKKHKKGHGKNPPKFMAQTAPVTSKRAASALIKKMLADGVGN